MTTTQQKLIDTKSIRVRPVLKWVGGKTQMLSDLEPYIPTEYNRYIEPFFGGGALFFNLQPTNSVLSDSNPELVNLYTVIRDSVEDLIIQLKNYENDKDLFYEIRRLNWLDMNPTDAAARTIFLNKTCFNGLYRVNKSGGFNVPFAGYKNPTICDSINLRQASSVLQGQNILCDDYENILNEYAKRGDFIFLDPPYLPISKYSDFKRYTKEQFHLDDHYKLAEIVGELVSRGCCIILTNSNHEQVREMYSSYEIKIVQTKRHINCKGDKRNGEDLIVFAK
jgi:DNA adenine methylase